MKSLGTKRIVWPTTYTPVSIYNRLLMLFAICHMRISLRRVLHPLTVYKFALRQCIIQSCQFYVLLLTGLFLNARRGYSSSDGTKSWNYSNRNRQSPTKFGKPLVDLGMVQSLIKSKAADCYTGSALERINVQILRHIILMTYMRLY